ncbi:hypothetical protein UUC_03535 [Rhodanobacter denitrificans]|nr:hypothetical protein UUC_03535 [Rhodanobacter denitrificans]
MQFNVDCFSRQPNAFMQLVVGGRCVLELLVEQVQAKCQSSATVGFRVGHHARGRPGLVGSRLAATRDLHAPNQRLEPVHGIYAHTLGHAGFSDALDIRRVKARAVTHQALEFGECRPIIVNHWLG